MSHEPECTFLNEPKSVSGSCWCCAGIRAAYQRGREDAARVIRDIHSPSKDNEPGCMGCGTDPDYWDDWREMWPCPTIRALDGDK